jgi:hypothetical protein
MGVAPSFPILPVMSCSQLAALADENEKTEIGRFIRENEIDGAVAAELDDDMVAELTPSKVQQLKLKKALQQLKQSFEDKDAQEEHAHAEESAAASSTFEAGTWKVLLSTYILGVSPDQPLPECRKLEAAGVLRTIRATDEEVLLGELLDKTLIISHRWESPEHPDPECTKLKKIQDHLRSRPEIDSIWLDYTCLPQGKKDPSESAFFDYCLYNVNLLYLAGRVLVFVDKECKDMHRTAQTSTPEVFRYSHPPLDLPRAPIRLSRRQHAILDAIRILSLLTRSMRRRIGAQV